MDPAEGGPTEGVRRLGVRLNELGHNVEILTLDAPSQPYVHNSPITTHAIGPSQCKYRRNPRLVPWLKANAANYDAVIVNGIWNYHAFGTWRALNHGSVPYFVFIHGMLDPWFKRRYPLKHIKKWLYWPWADYRVVRDAAAVLFTSEMEMLGARESFWLYAANEKLVRYGTKTPPSDSTALREIFINAHAHLRGKRVMLYLGRIHEKKGGDLLIRAFASTARENADIHLVMAGPDSAGWVSKLKSLAQRLSISDRITWPGMLQGDMKWGAYYVCEAFILPSHQENFGIAVAEALGCARPVLISDKVNIWREIAAAGAGMVESDDLAGTQKLLSRWLSLDSDAKEEMSRSALKAFRQNFTVEAMADHFIGIIGAKLAERAFTTVQRK
jgi:glycosyltransferase involved in cell wall biosynthesis